MAKLMENISLLSESNSPSDSVIYMDKGSQTVIQLNQSRSSFGASHSQSVPSSAGRRFSRLSDAFIEFETSGLYNITLSWKDLNVRVRVPGKRGFPFGESQKPYNKTILNKVSGMAEPGSLLAIMGASGSGKSTLLNVLTSRNTKGYNMSGECMLNGVTLPPGGIKNVSAYVQQHDVFIDTLTVREQLQFRALLRMDKKLDEAARLNRVEEVIQEMGLGGCSDSRIGSSVGTKKGISGGERKRLAFACEALTNPPIFFCDEPTSNLDSFMAQSIVHTLQKMAAKGRVILCTIHQPSSELFAMFSQVLLLSEGRLAFMGSTVEALEFYRNQGYPCPKNFNPGDHYILTMAIVPGREVSCRRRTNAICDEFEQSDKYKEIKGKIEEQRQETDIYDHVVMDQVTGESRYQSSTLVQWKNLFWRSWTVQFRNTMLFAVRMVQVLVMAAIIGTVYFDLNVDQKGIMNINGALFLLITQTSMANMFAVLASFPEEQNIVMREYGSGLYSSAVYFITKILAEVPVFVLTVVVFTLTTYWTIGLRDDFGAFITAFWVILLSAMISAGLGYTVSVISGDTTVAMSIANLLISPLMLFAGVFLNGASIPDYFKPLEYVAYFKYAYELVMINQWNTFDEIGCPNITLPPNASIVEICSAMNCPYRSGEMILTYNTMSKDDEMEDTLWMLSLMSSFFVIAFFSFIIRARRSRE